jgi:hypothetical protein
LAAQIIEVSCFFASFLSFMMKGCLFLAPQHNADSSKRSSIHRDWNFSCTRLVYTGNPTEDTSYMFFGEFE